MRKEQIITTTNNTDVDPATGLTPYINMQKVLKVCHDFVDNFDNTFSNLLFIGQTGVGKTFLSNCIARALMDSCHSIIYLTAGEFFDSFKSDDFKEFGSSKFDTSFFVEFSSIISDMTVPAFLLNVDFVIIGILCFSAFISVVTFSFFSSLQKIVSPVKTGISAAAVIELVVEFKVHVGKSVSCHYLGFSFISGSVPDGDGWGRKRVNP